MASPAQTESTNQLQISDLAGVLQLLRRHGYSGVSYYKLGLHLGLTSPTLDIITKNNRDDVESCLRGCLTKWLLKADDVQKTKGGPTVYSLVSALRELGENGVADGIDMEKHPACRIFARYTSNQFLVSALPQFAALLYSENLIQEMMLTTNVPEEALLIQIKEAVCIDYWKLQALAVILCKVPATADIGYAIQKEYKKVFCGSNLIKSNDDNGEGLEIYFPQSLNSEFKSMRLKFVKIFFQVKSVITKNSSTLDDIKYILSIYDKALRPQLAQCHNINSVLELISENCSLNDICVLEFVVDQLNINEVKAIIQDYNETIKVFSRTKLTHYLEEKFANASPLKCETIVIVVDKDAAEAILNDVKKLSSSIFESLSQHVKQILVKRAESYAITCSFPLILSEQLITAALNNIDALKGNKVKRLTIGYCTVYEVKDTSTATTTEIDEYTSSLSTSSGLMKQLMLSLSVQLINSTDEITALNEESMRLKKETESLKEALHTKNKMLTASIAESDRFKSVAAETKQLLQEKISHLTEREKENENLKEIKELLEEQLALFQSEKEVTATEEFTETNEAKKQMQKEIEKQKINEGNKQLAERSDENKKEIEILQEKISRMSVEQIDKDESLKVVIREKEIINSKLDEMSELLEKERKESIRNMKEVESMKEALDTKNKLLSVILAESDRLKSIAAESSQLLQEKVSHLTEQEEENEKLKKIKELLEEQLASFQSEKEEVTKSLQEKIKEQDEEMHLLKIQLTTYQEKEGEEESFAKEIEKLQSATDKDEKPPIGKKIDKYTSARSNHKVTLDSETYVHGYDQLTIADLAFVDELLTEHGFNAANGYKLGLQLGLSPNTLDVIDMKWEKDGAIRCLWQYLQKWIKKADNVSSKGGATIPALIRALRKIGDCATADGICNECHPACRILQKYISVSDQPILDALPQLALHLQKEGIIDMIKLPETGGAKVLLSSVQKFVCDDDCNLEKFATILQMLPSTVEIGTLIRKDYILVKAYDKTIEIHDASNKRFKISRKDLNEFEAMRHTFAQAVHNACRAMKAIPSDDLKKFLCAGYPYLIPQLEHIVTTDDILYLVCSRCCVINISLLENVACHFKVDRAIAIIEEYRENLKEFKPLQKLLDEELFSGSSFECETITFIVEEDVDDYTLQDVELLLRHAFKELAPHVMIKVIREHH